MSKTSQPSYSKLVHNIMETMEENSNKFIESGCYYIVNIRVSSDKEKNEAYKEWAKTLLTTKTEKERPIVVYTHANEISLLFSCVSDNDFHYLKGSHQDICSYYACYFCKLSQSYNIKCNIVEFRQRSDIFGYLMWKIHQNTKKCINNVCKKLVSSKELEDKPLEELKTIMTSYDIDWDQITDEEKYGKFQRLRRKKKKLLILSLSEPFNAQDTKKYMSYLFS